MPRIFLITNTSTELGAHLVQEVLEKVEVAVASARETRISPIQGTTEKVLISHFYPTSEVQPTEPQNYPALEIDATRQTDNFGWVEDIFLGGSV
ncbi:hypothetical protein WAI453_011510 [Rhynchosporium graminicola]